MREFRLAELAESVRKGSATSSWLSTLFRSRYPNAHRGAADPGALYHFPWECLGSRALYHFPWECLGSRGKLVLFLPLVLVVALGLDDKDAWCFHMLVISALRYLHAFIWNFLAREPRISSKTRITAKRVEFKQADREENWDDYIILQNAVATLVHMLPFLYCSNGVCHKFAGFPLHTNKWGWLQLYLWHAGPTEAIYYMLHRVLHWHKWYAAYHSHHHASYTTEPITGSVHPFAEHLMYTANFAIPLLGTWLTGGFSVTILYAYLLGFDFLNCLGHCNFEFIPPCVFKWCPPLKYLIYTPTFHSLHHSKVRANYSLFMPLYDYLGRTLEPSSWTLQERAWNGQAAAPKTRDADPPDAIFLGHGTDLASVFHLPWMSRTLSVHPYYLPWYVQLLTYPVSLPFLLFLRWIGHSLPHSRYEITALKKPTTEEDENENDSASATREKSLNIQVMSSPVIALQFAFQREWNFINGAIERTILDMDAAGVKVFGLGALNKNEALNGGGSLFVERNPYLKLRLVHGNTLTAASVIVKIPKTVTTAFCLGATSKLGKAISIYLAARGVRVLMLTASKERFEKCKADAMKMAASRGISPGNVQRIGRNLVHVHNMKDGENIDTWIVGRPLSIKEQRIAPVGSTFHQFVVPPLELTGPIRSDCLYTRLPAFHLPVSRTRGLRACEMTLDRGVIHACHAGMLVHALEGWRHHEVGAVDPERIDRCWSAAMKHEFVVSREEWLSLSVKDSYLGAPLLGEGEGVVSKPEEGAMAAAANCNEARITRRGSANKFR
eukprot:g79722.t1